MTPRRLILFAITALAVLLAPGSSLAKATPTPYLCPFASTPKCWCDTSSGVLSDSKAEICLFVAFAEPYPDPILTTTGTPCLDANGEALCAMQLEFTILSGAPHTFTPAPSVSAHDYTTNSWRANWLAPDAAAMPANWSKHVGTLELLDPDGLLSAAQVSVTPKSLAVKTNLTLVSIAHGPIAVPEPSLGSLLAAGLLLLGLLARARPRQASAAIVLLSCIGWGASPAGAAILESASPLVNGDLELASPSELGTVITGVGDLNGDGVEDLAIGFPTVFGGQGGVLLAFLRHDGTVNQTQFIADGKGGLAGGSLGPNAGFGSAMAIMTDMDGGGPGAVALTVSAPGELAAGSIWLLILAPDPSGPHPVNILSAVQIPTTDPAYALAAVDDVNFDGLPDLALGLENYADGGCPAVDCGAMQILHIGLGGAFNFFEPVITEPFGLSSGSLFGASLASLGDVNGDGFGDIAVGSPGFDNEKGAVWILFLIDLGGGAISQLLEDGPDLLSSASSTLAGGDQFGASLAAAGDLDGNGTTDLVAGLPGRDGVTLGSTAAGSIAFLALEPDGTQTRPGIELNDAGGEIPTAFGQADSGTHTAFGHALAELDVDGDGDSEIFVGAATDLIESSAGILWRLGLDDPDGDLLPDALGENCQGVSNAAQSDSDGDGVGDACDNCPDVGNGANTGICLAGDNLGGRGFACTSDADCESTLPGSGLCSLDQSDVDGDGVGDACEQVVVTLNEGSVDDWSLELDCGAFNVERLSVALLAPDETAPLNLEFGGVAGVPNSGCDSPGFSLLPPGPGGPTGNGCDAGGVPVPGIGPTIDAESGVFESDPFGTYTFPVGTVYSGLRPNTLFAWLQGTPRLCSAGDTVHLVDLEIAGGLAPEDLAVSASNLGLFSSGFLFDGEVPLPALTGCLISKPPPTDLGAKSGRSFRALSLGPDLFADVSPLPPSGLGHQDWEVCFKSDNYIRKIKVAVEPPTGKYGSTAFVPADVEWLGCPTASAPDSPRDCLDAFHYPIATGPGESYEQEPTSSSKHYYVLTGNRPGHTNRLNSTLNQAPFVKRYNCLGTVRVTHGTNLASHAPVVSLKGDSYLDSSLPENQTDPLTGVVSYPSSLLGVGGSSSCTVPEDLDGDGVRTEADNCPYLANSDQIDQGGFDPSGTFGVDEFSPAASYDGIGDACQCGEGNGNGTITIGDEDLPNFRKYMLGFDVPLIEFNPARCNVRNDLVNTAKCNILDAMLLKRALEGATGLPNPALC
ncbi:MAG: hypothetical protein NZ990_15785, partial [Myxococcota bacterium]|nr:hypothetical protein [Myxococcota bacterium]